MSAETPHSCPKGFLITPATDDPTKYVPFFIKVREEDIIWNAKPTDIENLFMDGLDPAASTGVLPPSKTYTADYRGWHAEIKLDNYIVLTKKFNFSLEFVANESRTEFTLGDQEFPFMIKKDGAFNIQVTNASTYEEFRKSFITPTTYSFFESVHIGVNFKFERFNGGAYSHVDNPAFDDITFYVTVSGHIHC